MYTLPEKKSFTTKLYKDNCTKLGNVSKTNRVISGRENLERVEELFMSISFKANRSDNQRNDRRVKR